jgi:hypothetical protein
MDSSSINKIINVYPVRKLALHAGDIRDRKRQPPYKRREKTLALSNGVYFTLLKSNLSS